MGLNDREYMRLVGHRLTGRFVWTATKGLVVANVVVFLLQLLLPATAEGAFYNYVLLFPGGILSGKVWTLISYAFFHGNFYHILGNMLGLWFAGNVIERGEGRARLLLIYFGGIILGGFFWLVLAFAGTGNSPLLGASAGVFAVMTYVLAQQFNRLVWVFPWPFSIRSKWVLVGFFVITLSGLLFSEIPATTGWWRVFWAPGIGHSGHLGGMAWGGAVFGWSVWQASKNRFVRRKVAPLRQTIGVRSTAPGGNVVNFKSDKNAFQAEVDRILDKIHASGADSLSDAEQQTLERARVALLRR